MPLDQKAIIKQIDDILAKSNLTSPHRYEDFSDLSRQDVSEGVNLLYSAIGRLAPIRSPYIKNASAYEGLLTGNIGEALSPLRGILRAIRADYEAGYLQSAIELIHADVFADFFEMADYLIQQGYKDPAAVIAGSVLEAHLRKLCDKHGIPTVKADGKPKTADALNSELARANIYSKLDQTSVTAWQALRNKAAHGKYSEYTKDQVALMIPGVLNFASRNPA